MFRNMLQISDWSYNINILLMLENPDSIQNVSQNTERIQLVKSNSCNISCLTNKKAFFLATLRGLRDLSSPARDWTQATAVQAWNPNH